jgi:hypothetical protein
MEREFRIVLEGTYRQGNKVTLPLTKKNKIKRVGLISRLLRKRK